MTLLTTDIDAVVLLTHDFEQHVMRAGRPRGH